MEWSLFRYVSFLAAGALFAAPGGSAAGPRLSGHIEGGLGFADVRPLTSPTTLGATVWVGGGVPLGRGRATLEIAATVGDDIGAKVPEGPFSGSRSLTTFLLGMELVDSGDARGFFVSAGVGIGHWTLSGATRGWCDFPDPGWSIPARDLTAFAFGGGAGFRTCGGPGPLGFQLALRFHGAVDAARIAASGTALTLGLAY